MKLIDAFGKYQNLIIVIAVLATGLLSGGISWQYLIVPNILLMLYLSGSNIKKVKFNYTIILIIAILISGIVSISLTSADKQNAIHEFMKIIIFALAFCAGMTADKKTIFNAICVLGTVLSVTGILGYCNILRIDEFVFNDRTYFRLQSFVKFANVTAILLGISYFVLLDEYKETKKIYIPHISVCILLSIYLTISKAAIPIFLVVGTAEVILNKKYAKYFFLQNIICLIVAFGVILAVRNHYYSISALMVVACIAITGTLSKNSMPFNADLKKFRPAIVLIAVIGIICASIYAASIDVFATLVSRLVYSKDAMRIIKSDWLFGIGAGGWKYYQYGVQSIGYNVNYVHNGMIQLWLDYGLFGFVAFVAIFITGAINAFKKKEYVLFGIIIFITAHSMIDIDLSFGVILIVYGLIAGFIAKDGKQDFCFKPFIAIVLIICVLFETYSVCDYMIRADFENNYLNNDYKAALKSAYRLEKICPLDSNLKVSIGSLDPNKTEINLEKAAALSPLDKNICLKYINYQIDNKRQINISELSAKFINLAPKQESTYVQEQDFLRRALKNGLCDGREYDEMIARLNQRRNKEGVVDRNKLLNEINGIGNRED